MRVLTNKEERLIYRIYMGEYIRRNYGGVPLPPDADIQYNHNNQLDYVFTNTDNLDAMRKEYISYKRQNRK